MNQPADRLQNRWIIIGFLLSVAFITAYNYYLRIDQPFLEARRQLQNQILQGTAESPYRYRVLVPYTTHVVDSVISGLTGKDGFKYTYAIYDAFAIFLSLGALYLYTRIWFTPAQTLIGVLFAAISMTVGFRDHYFQPWSLLEPAIFAFGLYFIVKKHWLALGALILIGALNRETTVFILAAFFFTQIPLNKMEHAWWIENRAALLRLVIYGVIWLAVFVGLRLMFGQAPQTETLAETLQTNLKPQSLSLTLELVILFLGAYWIFAGEGWKHSPTFLKRSVWVIPVYMIFYLVFGIWYEVRLLTTMYVVWIPLGLCYLFLDSRLRELSSDRE